MNKKMGNKSVTDCHAFKMVVSDGKIQKKDGVMKNLPNSPKEIENE